jgi:ribosomal protein L37AE/L43A
MKIILTEDQAKRVLGETVECPKCEHEWTIEPHDNHPYLCHTCGWDQKQKTYKDKELFNFWKEKLSGEIEEKWSEKYKKSIDCNNPKGFSQRAHCQGRNKKDKG